MTLLLKEGLLLVWSLGLHCFAFVSGAQHFLHTIGSLIYTTGWFFGKPQKFFAYSYFSPL
jgi:hypothetical protein